MTGTLFALSLVIVAPPAPAGLQKGDEFTFVGTVSEGVERPADRFRRSHALELRVFVLDRQDTWADAAVFTRLTRTADVVTSAVGTVTGTAPEANATAAVRIDIVRVNADGTVHLLAPPGPTPLKLAADTPARTLPLIPLDAFAPFEFGIFPPRVPRNAPAEPFTIGAAGNRPAEVWQAKGFEFVTAERCQLLVMNQQHADWEKPVGGQTSWHRAEQVCVSTQDGTARKVWRVIRQRDGKATAPAAWVEVKYELKEQTRLSGRTFDRVRRECEVAYAALADVTLLAPDAVKLGPKTFETRLVKLNAHLEETDQSSPYREPMLAARRALDAARRGEVSALAPLPATAPATVTKPMWPEAGQAAPDFKAGTFRLSEQKGKPVVLVFFKPSGETADRALAIADALEKRYAGKATVVALAVFGEVAAGVKDRDRLKFTVAVHDGAAAVPVYGIDTAPRFALIDDTGKVRWSFAGVGAETGYLLKVQADQLVAPASPAPAAGTIPSRGPDLPLIVPRP